MGFNSTEHKADTLMKKTKAELVAYIHKLESDIAFHSSEADNYCDRVDELELEIMQLNETIEELNNSIEEYEDILKYGSDDDYWDY